MPNGKLMVMVCTALTTSQSRLLTSTPPIVTILSNWFALGAATPQLGLPVHLPLSRLNGHTRITTPLPMMSSILKQISAFRHICRLQFPLRFQDVGQEDPLQYSAATISALFRKLIAPPLPSLPTSPLSLTLPLRPFPSHTPGPASSLI